jgi:hypothetical protein
MGDWRYRRANRGLRDASLALSAVRDAKVVMTTVNSIMRGCESYDTQGNRMVAALERVVSSSSGHLVKKRHHAAES